MFRQHLKYFKWMCILSVLISFVGFPLIPVYGWVRPWHEGEAAMRQHGIKGMLFMLSGGWGNSYTFGAAGESWSKERTRTFLAFPESFRAGELFACVEKQTSGMAEPRREIVPEKGAVTLIAEWLLSGIISMIIILRWIRPLNSLGR